MSKPMGVRGDLDVTGREQEIARLVQILDEASRLGGAPQVVFVRGPAGIGKSFLLDTFTRAVHDRGARILSGTAARGAASPYGLFASVVPSALSHLAELGLPTATIADLTRRTVPITGRAAREAPLAGPGRTAEDRRLDLFDAVADVFGQAGRHQPPVILLDDVDAADAASLELLRYLLASAMGPASAAAGSDAVGARALWVIAFRDDDALPTILADVVARTPASTLPLDGLDTGGLRAFLSRPAMVERILDTTGGVPERIEALLTADTGGGVAALLDRRIAALPPEAQDVLSVLAVVGRPARLCAIEAILRAWTGGEAAPALDTLVAERLVSLRTAADGPVYGLTRMSDGARLCARLAPGRRSALHGIVGRRLAEDVDAEPAEVARHLLEVDPAGSGFAWAVRAGKALVDRLAYGEAAEAFAGALTALEEPDDPRALDLYERLFELHTGLSEYPAALRWLGRLKRACRRDPARLREIRGQAARACLAMGRARLADRLCREVLGLAPDKPVDVAGLDLADPVAVRAHADLAEATWTLGDYEQAVAIARAGLDVLDADPDPSRYAVERLSLQNTLGKLHLHRGEYAEAETLFARSAEEAGGHGRPRERARALNNLGVVAHRQGRRREALESYRASLALRQGSGDRTREAFALQNIAALYHETGEIAAALDHYHRALSAFTRCRNAAQVSRTACNLANLYLFLGDLDRAASLSDHARALADEVCDPYLQGYAAMVCGDLARARGERSTARRQYELALDHLARIDSPRYTLETRLALAGLACEEGDLRHARAHLEAVSSVLRDRQFTGLGPTYHLVGAEVHLSAGETDAAARSLARARDLLLDAPDLEGPVRLYFLMGRLREALGDESGADANLARAQRLLDELSARVPASHRNLFVSLPRRRAVLDAAGGREITPARIRRALSLEDAASPPRPGPDADALEASGIIGRNARLRRVLSLIDRVAGVSQPVLIRGPSGSGKELIADAIHRAGPRRDRPFLKINCAAMHEELLLSELFGHEKGAFTGAHQARKGRFELADGGTLFLDEIGDVSPKVQVALLRVLQQQEFERVGGNKTLRVDVRVICATNRNLEEMIAGGDFREDLYYRLKGVMLEVPSLGERLDDLPELVEHFLQKAATERSEPRRRLAPEVMNVLSAYPWPGNIRELEHVIQSLSLFARGETIEVADLEHHPELLAGQAHRVTPETGSPVVQTPTDDGEAPPDFFGLARSTGLSLKDLKREVEVQCIRRALEEADGNISEAARLLGMKRSRLSQIVNADDALKALAAR
jgi:DNA-binding NtrC family response regulator/tetratricopeptide (TPR) repeat protein